MSFLSDLKILWHMSVSPIRGKTHSERLESFYSKQAQGYDDFRRRLLQGRKEMWDALTIPEGATAVDMGGGTGANLEFLGDRISHLKQLHLVDLSGSLLKVAQQRIEARGWANVKTVEADATTWMPPEPVDIVTFSYSLTMIPDWFAAIDQAKKMLKPGGTIGIVDFYVARKYPEAGRARHSWMTSTFWPNWFRFDNVFPSPDHVPYLHKHFEPIHFSEHRARIPYMLFSRVPYYVFIGKKPMK
ncbi:MAG: SAM-dependent methyltransferase [Planctomycetaceae bacterium]|nr:SAM-dependent methyltransferase [Planctomycetaceae bacterium]